MSVLRIRRDPFLDYNFTPICDWRNAEEVIRREMEREISTSDHGYMQRLRATIHTFKLCEREGMEWPGSIGALMAQFRGAISDSPAQPETK